MSLQLQRRELDFLLETLRAQYVPNMFRTVLQVESRVPAWAGRVETQKVTQYASFKPVSGIGDTLPKPTLARAQTYLNLYQFAASYEMLDLEVERCRAMQLNLPAELALANQQASEMLLDDIAVGLEAVIGLPGIANNSTVYSNYLNTKAGLAWASEPDPENVLIDMHGMVNAVAVNSKQYFKADTIVLPLAAYHTVVTRRLGQGTDETILTAFLKQSPYCKRVLAWNKLAAMGGASANSGTRAVALDTMTPGSPRMIIAQELQDSPPIRKLLGNEIAQSFITGGVLVQNETSLCYLDAV